MRIKELEDIARTISYCEPYKPQQEWSEDEITNYALYHTLNNYPFYRCLYIILDMLPPVKMIYKTKLKNYISTYSSTQPSIGEQKIDYSSIFK